jgi:hypothetical protein
VCGDGTSPKTRSKKLASGKTRHHAYYYHRGEKPCAGFTAVPERTVGPAVFEMLREFTYDQAAFQKAVAEQIGDRKDTAKLKRQITKKKSSLSRIERQLSGLIDMRSADEIEQAEYEQKRTEYKSEKIRLTETIAKLETRLASWLESEKFIADAHDLRRKWKGELESPEHFENMTYEQKVDLLDYFFSGEDDDGRRFGIYVQKNAQGDFELELYGRYLMGPDRYDTIKRRPAIYTFTARKTLGKDGLDLEKRKERVSKEKYQSLLTGSGHQP